MKIYETAIEVYDSGRYAKTALEEQWSGNRTKETKNEKVVVGTVTQ